MQSYSEGKQEEIITTLSTFNLAQFVSLSKEKITLKAS